MIVRSHGRNNTIATLIVFVENKPNWAIEFEGECTVLVDTAVYPDSNTTPSATRNSYHSTARRHERSFDPAHRSIWIISITFTSTTAVTSKIRYCLSSNTPNQP